MYTSRLHWASSLSGAVCWPAGQQIYERVVRGNSAWRAPKVTVPLRAGCCPVITLMGCLCAARLAVSRRRCCTSALLSQVSQFFADSPAAAHGKSATHAGSVRTVERTLYMRSRAHTPTHPHNHAHTRRASVRAPTRPHTHAPTRTYEEDLCLYLRPHAPARTHTHTPTRRRRAACLCTGGRPCLSHVFLKCF